MSDSRSANNDPSMDDILASIRKIISDDEARAQVNSQQAASQAGRPDVVPPATEPKSRPAGDDVLMLTDLIEEPKPGDTPPPIPLPRIDPARAAEMPQPSVEPPPEPSLVGVTVAGAATSAFARLNQAVQDSVPPPVGTRSGPCRRRQRQDGRRPGQGDAAADAEGVARPQPAAHGRALCRTRDRPADPPLTPRRPFVLNATAPPPWRFSL